MKATPLGPCRNSFHGAEVLVTISTTEQTIASLTALSATDVEFTLLELLPTFN